MIEWAIAGLAAVFSGLAVVNAIVFLRARHSRGSFDAQVSVLIPARNEESNLDGCIESVLRQGDSVAEVLIYDDQSDDATPQVSREWSRRDRRVRLLETVPLPEGWLGKPHACYRLAMAARSRWLLFLDADARLEAGAIEQLLATAQEHNASLLSAWPAIEMHTPAEQLLMPMLTFYVMTLFPSPLQLFSIHQRYALAHGACILSRRDVYLRIGGHRLVRTELFEDTALARHWRRRKERSLCCDGGGIVRVRMYRTIGDIWRGFQKNFYPGFRKKWLFPMVLALHAVVFAAPFFVFVASPNVPAFVALSSVVVARVVLAVRFRHPLWSVLAHPLAELFLIALGIRSWWQFSRGHGIEWKQRQYAIGRIVKSVR